MSENMIVILSSSLIAAIIGGCFAILGTLIQNIYNKKTKSDDIRYSVIKKVYDTYLDNYDILFESAEDIYEESNYKNLDDDSVRSMFLESLLKMYNISQARFKKIKNLFLKVRVVLDKDVVERISKLIKSIEAIERKIYFTALQDNIGKEQLNKSRVVVNPKVEIYDDADQIQTGMRNYIDTIESLRDTLRDEMEKELKKIIK